MAPAPPTGELYHYKSFAFKQFSCRGTGGSSPRCGEEWSGFRVPCRRSV